MKFFPGRKNRRKSGAAVQRRLDRLRDGLTTERLRRSMLNVRRRIGLTTGGQLALLAAVATWVVARVIAGTPLFVLAYGLFLLVVSGYILARTRRMKLTAARA